MRLRDLTDEEIAAEWDARCDRYRESRRRVRIALGIGVVTTGVTYLAIARLLGYPQLAELAALAFAIAWLAPVWYARNQADQLLKCPRCSRLPATWPLPPPGRFRLLACDGCLAPLTRLVPPELGSSPVADAPAHEWLQDPRVSRAFFAASLICLLVAFFGLMAVLEHFGGINDPEWLDRIFPFGLARDLDTLLVLTAGAGAVSWISHKLARL